MTGKEILAICAIAYFMSFIGLMVGMMGGDDDENF